MEDQDTATVDPELPQGDAAPETNGEAAAPGSPAPESTDTDEDAAAAQARAWFNGEDEEGQDASAEATGAAATDEDTPPGTPVPEKPAPTTPTDQPEPQTQAQQPAPKGPPAFDFQAVIQESLASIPGTIKVGDKDVDVTPFLKDFHEAPAVFGHLMNDVLQKTVGPFMHMMQQQQARLEREEFFQQVAEHVPDVRKIASSGDFQTWLQQQPQKFREIAADPQIESAVFVLKQYAAARRTPATPPARQPQRPAAPASPAFDRRKASLTSTLGGKTAPRAAGAVNRNDYKAAFDEEP